MYRNTSIHRNAFKQMSVNEQTKHLMSRGPNDLLVLFATINRTHVPLLRNYVLIYMYS